MTKRLLYHCINWGGTTPDVAEEVFDLSPELLYELVGMELVRSPESIIYEIAQEYYGETGTKIPALELNERLKRQCDDVLYKRCVAAARAAKVSGSDGSDVPFIIERLKTEGAARKLKALLIDAASNPDLIETEPDKVINKLMEELQQAGDTTDSKLVIPVNERDVVEGRLVDYSEKMLNDSPPEFLMTGIPSLDDHVGGGFSEGQVVLVVAQTKTGKSCFCLATVIRMLLNEDMAGRPCDILIANREMKNEWQQERLEAFLMSELEGRDRPGSRFVGSASLLRKIRNASLNDDERELWVRAVSGLTTWRSRVWMADPRSYETLDDLELMIANRKRERPIRVVYVDALNNQRLKKYKRFTDKEYQAQGELIRRLEHIATNQNVLIVAESQEKTEAADRRHVNVGDLVALSGQLAWVASHVIRLYKINESLVECQLVASRFAPVGFSVPLWFVPGDMFLKEAPREELLRAGELV